MYQQFLKWDFSREIFSSKVLFRLLYTLRGTNYGIIVNYSYEAIQIQRLGGWKFTKVFECFHNLDFNWREEI